MKICVFDTETTGLEKPFCYNIGYIIVDTDFFDWKTLVRREYVVEQIWHNLPLFNTAYYADKRPLYVSAMRARKVQLEKFGYITQQMARDFKQYNVEYAYAYNSSFDEKVFNFNCDWFKVINPFDNIPIYDIRGFAHHFLIDDAYKAYCERFNLFTDSGNYSTTAEAVFRYLSCIDDFKEEHTALADSELELEILYQAELAGADLTVGYQAERSIPRNTPKTLTIKKDGEKIFSVDCENYTLYKKNHTIVVR